MLSLAFARQLKEAGLPWEPAQHDFFAIPDRDLDDPIFIVADMTVNLEQRYGEAVFAFHGAMEWALDAIVTGEAVWLPTETQLRQALEQRLPPDPARALVLICTPLSCRCEFQVAGQFLSFEAPDAEAAYARALLHLLAAGRQG